MNSEQVKRLSDIEKIDRFAEPDMEGPLCDVLWADPLSEDDVHKLTNDEYQQFLDTEYVVNQVGDAGSGRFRGPSRSLEVFRSVSRSSDA